MCPLHFTLERFCILEAVARTPSSSALDLFLFWPLVLSVAVEQRFYLFIFIYFKCHRPRTQLTAPTPPGPIRQRRRRNPNKDRFALPFVREPQPQRCPAQLASPSAAAASVLLIRSDLTWRKHSLIFLPPANLFSSSASSWRLHMWSIECCFLF